MAGSNQKEVDLALRVSTLGADGIQRLGDSLRALAQEGGDAAPAFERLADEVTRLGQQAKQLDQFGTLSREVAELAQQQNVAAETASILYGELVQLRTATEQFEQAELAAKNALKQAQTELQGTKDEYALLRLAIKEAGEQTDEQRTQALALQRTMLQQEQTVRALRDAYAAAKDATKAASNEEAAMATRVAASNRETQASAAVLNQRTEALREARGELAAMGIATDDMAAAQAKLLTSLNATASAAEAERAAMEQWAEEERQLAAVQFQTHQQMAQAAKAEADGILADYARMEAAERQREEDLRASALAAQQAAQKIAEAFSTVGVKSVQELELEIARVREAMNTLKNQAGLTGPELDRAMAMGQARIKELEVSVRSATGSLTLMDRATSLFKSTIGQVAAGFGIVDTLQRLTTGFLNANKQMQAMTLGLTAVYKNSDTAASQIEFLRSVADRAGVSVGDMSQEFVKFSASMQAANIPIEQSNALFAALTQSAGTLGLSGEKVGEILNAVGQMAAKGTVSMEELRQQLGDSLPGALGLTAKGLGITEQQLIKLVESGGLMARDMLPALTRSLQGMSGEVNTLNSTWERFKNLGTETAQVVGDSGWVDALKGALVELGAVLGPIGLGLSTIFETIFTVVRMIGTTIAALVTGDLKDLGGALKEQLDAAIERQTKLALAYQRMIGVADDASAAHTKTAQATQGSGQAAQTAAGQVASHTGALQANTGAATGAAQAQTMVATAAEQAAAKAALASSNIVQLGVQYATLATQLSAATTVAEKMVKAQEIEAASLGEIVKMRGNERAVLDQTTASAEGKLAADQRLLTARQAEVDALRNYIAQLQEEIRLQGDPDGTRAKDLTARQQKLNQLEAEAQRTRETVEADKSKIASAELARRSYEDNSKAIDQYKAAMDAANQALREVQVLEVNGKATREQVIDATRRAAEAEGLYRDALKDSAAAAERAIQAIQNKNIVEQAALGVDAERAKSLGALAKATGDHTLATQAEIDSIQVEIKQRLANAQAISDEVKVKLQEIDATRAAQIALGSWTAEKEAEYQKTRAGLDAKKLESDAIKESTESLKRQIDALREGQNAQDTYGASTRSTTADIKAQAAALKELYDRNKIVTDSTKTADGYTKNKDGSAAGQFNNNLPIDLAMKLKETGGKGMSADEIKQAIQQADNAYQDMQAFTKLNPGASSIKYQQDVTALENAANTARSVQNAGVIGGGRGTVQGSNGGANGATGGTRTVNIQIGGVTKSVNVASQADSDTLVAALRQLETASGTAA